MTNPGRAAGHPSLDELARYTVQQRIDLMRAMSAKGFEPGCWIEVDDNQLIDSRSARDFIAGHAAAFERLRSSSWAGIDEFDGEHPSRPPPQDGRDRWVIISQSCELARDIREEPLVQLALLREAESADDLPNWARNSNRWIPLDRTGTASRHYVDLRVQAFAAKHVVAEAAVQQGVPLDNDNKQRPRTRFALRVGQRFSRNGIPTALIESTVDPLAHRLSADRQTHLEADATFHEWLLERDHPDRLIAVAKADPASPELERAEDFFEAFLTALPADLQATLDLDASRVVALEDLQLVLWLDCYKLDLDQLTFGSKGERDSPLPLA